MDDSLAVGFIQSVGDLRGVAQQLSSWERALRNARGQRLAFQIFHHQVLDAVLIADVVEHADVRMAEAGNGARLTLEALANFGRVGYALREDFDGDGAVQARIARAIHFAHAASAEERFNLVGAEFGAGGESHWRAIILLRVVFAADATGPE